jgi:hypothetical protein
VLSPVLIILATIHYFVLDRMGFFETNEAIEIFYQVSSPLNLSSCLCHQQRCKTEDHMMISQYYIQYRVDSKWYIIVDMKAKR